MSVSGASAHSEVRDKFDYQIIYGSEIFYVNPKTFSRMSGRFNQIFIQNPEKYIVESTNMPVDVFQVFVTACQLQTFTASPENVWELRQLGEEWEVPSLIKYCNTYLDTNKIQDVPAPDIVSQLIKSIERNDESQISIGIRLASSKFQQVLADPRFQTIPTDVIYKILSLIETRPDHQKAFITFVMKLLPQNPEIAVPLVLRMNFDLLDEEDYNLLFCNGEIHEQNINYFTARSTSMINTSVNQKLNIARTRFDKDHAGKKEHYSNLFKTLFDTTEQSRENDLDKIRLRLVQQQEDLNDLAGVLELQRSLLIEQAKIAHKAPSNKELFFKAKEDIVGQIRSTKVQMLSKVKQDKEDLEKEMQKLISESQQRIAQNSKASETHDTPSMQKMEDLRNRFKQSNDRLDQIQTDLKVIRATVAAKLVRDKLRGDKFLRKIENRFMLFEESPGVWDLSKEDVLEAEARIDMIEHRIEEKCPIRKSTAK